MNSDNNIYAIIYYHVYTQNNNKTEMNKDGSDFFHEEHSLQSTDEFRNQHEYSWLHYDIFIPERRYLENCKLGNNAVMSPKIEAGMANSASQIRLLPKVKSSLGLHR